MLSNFLIKAPKQPYPFWAKKHMSNHTPSANFTILKKRTIIGDDKLIVHQYGKLVTVKIHSGEVYLYLHSTPNEATKHVDELRSK